MQRRWLELLKDNDMSLYYYPGKANMVIDALSRLSMGSFSHVDEEKLGLIKDIYNNLKFRLLDYEDRGVIVQEVVKSFLGVEVKEK